MILVVFIPWLSVGPWYSLGLWSSADHYCGMSGLEDCLLNWVNVYGNTVFQFHEDGWICTASNVVSGLVAFTFCWEPDLTKSRPPPVLWHVASSMDGILAAHWLWYPSSRVPTTEEGKNICILLEASWKTVQGRLCVSIVK